MATHQIEPELNRAPPRRVRAKQKTPSVIVLLRLLLLSMWAGAGLLALFLTHAEAVRQNGTLLACNITERVSESDSDGNPLFYVTYRVKIQGVEREERAYIDEVEFDSVKPPMVAQLKISPWFPGMNSSLLVPGHAVSSNVGFMLFQWLVFLVWTAFYAWFCVILPRVPRRLVAKGIPVIATITEKSNTANKEMTANILHYEFTPRSPAESSAFNSSPTERIVKSESVSNDLFINTQIGDQMTVLYDARKPRHCLVYAFSDYVAEN